MRQDETEQSIKTSINFAKKIKPTYARFYTATPFPGTEFFEMAQQNKRIVSHDWTRYDLSSCDIYHAEFLTPQEISYWIKRATHEFYMRPRYVLSTAARFKNPITLLSLGASYLISKFS